MSYHNPNEPEQRPLSAANDPWRQIQAAVFGPTKVKTAGGVKSLPLYQFYFENLLSQAMKGIGSASQEHRRLMTFLEGREKLVEKPRDPAFEEFDRNQAIYDMKCDLTRKLGGIAYCSLRKEFREKWEAEYGPLPDFYRHHPYFIDVAHAEERERSRQRSMKRRNPTQVYDIGYRKPPPATRFQDGMSGNPSGKRAPGDDAWKSFRAGLTATCKSATIRAGDSGGPCCVYHRLGRRSERRRRSQLAVA